MGFQAQKIKIIRRNSIIGSFNRESSKTKALGLANINQLFQEII